MKLSEWIEIVQDIHKEDIALALIDLDYDDCDFDVEDAYDVVREFHIDKDILELSNDVIKEWVRKINCEA
jgi:hypothetical protein